MIQVRKNEVYRYLGYKKAHQENDLTQVDTFIDQCIDDLMKVVQPVSVVKRFPLRIEGETIYIEDMCFQSHSLAINLKDCQEVYMFSASAGIGVDRMIKRAEITHMSQAAIYQAVGAELVESICDDLNEKLREEVAREGLYLKPRFSPGYGDTSLQLQKDFERLLQMSKIGITLTDSLLMVPSKSVTAFIGITSKKTHVTSGCDACCQKDCPSRRE